jgi:N-acetylmuramoyl-L-alanine amidase
MPSRVWNPILVRDGDYSHLVHQAATARRAKHGLIMFVSIHADAFHKPTASGSSVFVLSTRGASGEAARWLADRENASDLVGGVSLDDKDNTLARVLLDLSQSATMKASDDVANHVLDAMKRLGKTHKPHVERANFVVLRSPDVPSMLVETAFISNPGEEKRLLDPPIAASSPPRSWKACVITSATSRRPAHGLRPTPRRARASTWSAAASRSA